MLTARSDSEGESHAICTDDSRHRRHERGQRSSLASCAGSGGPGASRAGHRASCGAAGPRQPAAARRLAGGAADRRVTFRIYAPQAQAVGWPPGDIPRRRAGDAADQGRERRLGGHGRPGRSRRVPLQLQRRRRDDDRSAQARSPANRTRNVWSLVYVPGSGLHGHAGTCRTARSRR